MKKHATLALAFFLAVTAVAAVLSSERGPGPESSVELTSEEAKPAGLIEDIFASLAPPPMPPASPTPPPPGYEPVGPGDRTPAGEPDWFRQFIGNFDGGAQGIFASFCTLSHSLPDDSIVYPRQPGASHLHDFFGAKASDANSTPDSLRGTATTCSLAGDSASYWLPALYQNGVRVEPDLMGAYYTAGGKNYSLIEPFPRGLKLLVKDPDNWTWYCMGGGGPTTYMKTAPNCPAGQHVGIEIDFPDCWDGMYLDVPDHKSHVAFSMSARCPSSHPVLLPHLAYFVNYPDARGGDLRFAPVENPSPVHADFLNAWDQGQQAIFVRDCIKANVNCTVTPP